MENIHEIYFYEIEDFIVTGQIYVHINKWYNRGKYIFYMVQLIFLDFTVKVRLCINWYNSKTNKIMYRGTTRKHVQLLVILFNIVLNVHHVLNVYHILNIGVEHISNTGITRKTIQVLV